MSVPQQTKGEALASLLASLGTAEDGGNDETTKAKLKGIADQLGVLLTETPTGDPNISGGQVLNEDGEPIMEITEHISDDSNVATAVPVSALEPPSESSSDNTAQTEIKDDEWFERRRRKREALMAQLELEEEETMGRERRPIPSNMSGNPRALTSRVEALKAATPPPNSALKSVERAPRERASTDAVKHTKTKQVSFVDDAPPGGGSSAIPTGDQKEEWANGAPGRLRDAKHESLRALKMDVVERSPGVTSEEAAPDSRVKKLSFKPRIVQIRQAEVDSDDEDQTSSTASTNKSDQDDEGDDDDPRDDDGEDDEWDEAMFQRELALAYYEQKGMLKQLRQSVQTPPTPNYSADPGNWEQENVPLDASLASSKHRSAISRFKAERTSQYRASNPLPADPFLATSVRHGKIVDGQLVGDPDCISDDEELNENAKRVMAELMGRRVDDDDGVQMHTTGLANNRPDSAAVVSPLGVPMSGSQHEPPASHSLSQSSPHAPIDPASSPARRVSKKISRFKQQKISSSPSGISPASVVNSSTLSPASLPAVFERQPPPISGTSGDIDTPTQSSLGVPTPSPNTSMKTLPVPTPRVLSTPTNPAANSAAHSLSSSKLRTSESVPAPFPSGSGTGTGGFASMILTPEQAAAPFKHPMNPTATRTPTPAIGRSVLEKSADSSIIIPSPASPAVSSVYGQPPPNDGRGRPQKVSRFKAERGIDNTV